MKRVIINKIFLVIMLALVLFASLSIIIVYVQTYSFYKENLNMVANNYKTKLTNIYINEPNKFDDRIEEFLNYSNAGALQINIMKDDGTVFGPTIDHFADSDDKDMLGERELGVNNKIQNSSNMQSFANEKIFLDAAMNSKSKTYKVKGLRENHTMQLAVALKINLGENLIEIKDFKPISEYYVLYTSIDIDHTNVAYYWILPTIFAIMILVMVVCYYFVKNMVRDIVDPIIDVKRILYDINRGDAEPIKVYSKYRDIQQIIDEVAIGSTKLNTTFKHLKYEQNKMDFLLNNMSQGIIALTSDNSVLMANKAVLKIFKNSKNLLGGQLDTLINDEELLDKIFSYSIGKKAQFEYAIEDRYYRIDIDVLTEDWYTETNLFIKIVIFNDISEEYQSAKIRSEFFANSSHELKTPLTAITGFSELLMMVDDKESKEKCAVEINQNAQKMLLLITDMLRLSKMEANMSEEDFEVINLRKIADEVIKKIQPLALNNNISLTIDGEAEIFGNPLKVEEVFTNLIDNAIKYSKNNGYVKVNINETHESVVVEVEDNGIGISSEHHARLFERFYVVDKSRYKKVDSTGLGLSIVKHIVQNHNGKISVESRLNEGTKFIVTFPKLVIDGDSNKASYDK